MMHLLAETASALALGCCASMCQHGTSRDAVLVALACCDGLHWWPYMLGVQAGWAVTAAWVAVGVVARAGCKGRLPPPPRR